MSQPTPPYEVRRREGYWIAVDTRTGRAASYPTHERAARADVQTLNRAWLMAMRGEV